MLYNIYPVVNTRTEHTCGFCGKPIKKGSSAYKTFMTVKSETKGVYYHTYCASRMTAAEIEECNKMGVKTEDYQRVHDRFLHGTGAKDLKTAYSQETTEVSKSVDAHEPAVEPEKCPIEKIGIYKMRNGKKAFITKEDVDGSPYEFCGNIEGDISFSFWGKDGSFYKNQVSEYDIVEYIGSGNTGVLSDFDGSTADDTLRYCGVDAKKWAQQFIIHFEQMPSNKNMDVDWVMGWFANAMMQMHDHVYNKEHFEDLNDKQHPRFLNGYTHGLADGKATADQVVYGVNFSSNALSDKYTEGFNNGLKYSNVYTWFVFIFSLLLGGAFGFMISGR